MPRPVDYGAVRQLECKVNDEPIVLAENAKLSVGQRIEVVIKGLGPISLRFTDKEGVLAVDASFRDGDDWFHDYRFHILVQHDAGVRELVLPTVLLFSGTIIELEKLAASCPLLFWVTKAPMVLGKRESRKQKRLGRKKRGGTGRYDSE